MHFDLQHIIHDYGYTGIAGALFLEMIGIPFPGETLLTLSGIEWSKGTFSLLPLLVIAIVSNILGSTVAFLIGRSFGHTLIFRYGKAIGLTHERFEKAEARFNKSPVILLIFAKFIAGVRVLVAYLAGINQMSFVKFSVYNGIGTVLWITIFVVFGRYVEIGWEKYHLLLHQYLVPIVIVLAVIILYFISKRKRNPL
ncbi:DedA family protein [Ammoniphilus resinae]|uniref:Membrane protein DedA with SNARE-associated domain n=1 Tax=Ammoniphilus resinae TaxID=861532 RepID=A0ABS4GSK2_9BACL|nr:DedA family protein [Ammoniphilus resinae]MBP1933007.1 membrane protein DedA with SNARE-associated domain [Ammoniphilus resinae]